MNGNDFSLSKKSVTQFLLQFTGYVFNDDCFFNITV